MFNIEWNILTIFFARSINTYYPPLILNGRCELWNRVRLIMIKWGMQRKKRKKLKLKRKLRERKRERRENEEIRKNSV